MSQSQFAPIVSLLVVLACAASAIADVLTTGPWPSSELTPERVPLGATLTVVSLLFVTWLILDSRHAERALAKVALTLLLVATAVWLWIIWPSFWRSQGLDDCLTDCMRDEHLTARGDVVQGKWAVMIASSAAASCVAAAVLRRFRAAQ